MSSRKDNWIDSILESTEGKIEQPVSRELYHRLLKIPNEVNKSAVVIPIRSVLLVAAGLALLITVNLLALNNSSKNEPREDSLYTAYFSYLDQV